MTAPAPHDGNRELRIVALSITVLSVVLGVYLFVQYSRVMSYVRSTIGYCAVGADGTENCVEPTRTPVWVSQALSPEECIDTALAWARECRGIKSMCDMYVEPVIRDCMASQDRAVYCDAIEPFAVTTYFGAAECRARGVRREVDKEACSNAYRAVASWCDRDRYDRGNGPAAAAP